MAKYQSMLVVIDPNQDDQPALRRAVYLHQRIGGRIKAFLPIYDFGHFIGKIIDRQKGFDASTNPLVQVHRSP